MAGTRSVRSPEPKALEQRRNRLVTHGTAAAIALVLAGATAQMVDYLAYGLRVRALDSNADSGIFGLVGDVALAGAALAAWVVLARSRRRTIAMLGLAPLLTFLAIDKAARLHDHVPHYLAVYLPVLAATGVLLVVVARPLPRPARRLILAGLILLGLAFVQHQLAEPLAERIGISPGSWIYQVKATLKHSTELAGWLLIALGLAAGALHDSAVPIRHASPGRPA